jgi:hypothetical protein
MTSNRRAIGALEVIPRLGFHVWLTYARACVRSTAPTAFGATTLHATARLRIGVGIKIGIKWTSADPEICPKPYFCCSGGVAERSNTAVLKLSMQFQDAKDMERISALPPTVA